MALRVRIETVAIALLVLATAYACATPPRRDDVAALNYGTCPVNYLERAKAEFRDDALYSYGGDPIVFPPQKFWYREPALRGGALLAGYVVPVSVDVKRRGLAFSLGRQTFGLLFSNNEVIKKIEPAEFETIDIRQTVGPLPRDERDWKVGFSDSKGNRILTELVPPGETVQNWSELITTQTFVNVRPAVTLDSFVQAYRASFAKGCRDVKWVILSQSPHEILLERHASACAPVRDEYAIEKLIRGVRTLNSVAYARATPFSGGERQKWLDIVSKSRLTGDCPQ